MRRLRALLTALSLVLAVAASLALPAGALADGDPGSDKLVYQNLFTGGDSGISTVQQVQLGNLLNATAKLGKPVRVAIVSHRDDLGTVTPLWLKPQAYAQYLGAELAEAYPGRLLVVMPNGIGVYWHAHKLQAPAGIGTGGSPKQLVAAAQEAVTKLEAAAGVPNSALAAARRADELKPSSAGAEVGTTAGAGASTAGAGAPGAPGATAATGSAGAGTTGASAPAPKSSRVSPVWIVLALLALLTSVFWLPPLWRRRPAWGVPAAAAAVPVVTIIAVFAVVTSGHHAAADNVRALATNPNVDPGSSPSGRPVAPNFTLSDETGRPVSLSRYRGKVVILSFTDAECQTICPLTTQAMADARRSLGAAAKHVQLLGVDANWHSHQIEDVLTYTQLHGMLGQWHFLTGDLRQLERVWADYNVAKDINAKQNLISHTPALFVIDTHGRIRDIYTTQQSYGAIGQFGQVLAHAAAGLLPSHPRVSTSYSYATVRGISPSTPTTLPSFGGGTVPLGSGGPHLYLFFATWDQESTAIAAQMQALDRYARDAHRLGLPPLTAVDEGSVEPDGAALGRFLGSLPHKLSYPVAIDRSGRVGDGYQVQGEPWFVLTDPGAANDHPWYQEVYTDGWPSLAKLERDVKASLKAEPSPAATAARALAGSPAPLAQLHAQASRLLSGGPAALLSRVKVLKGRPIVLNVWAHWCQPCQQEFPWFKAESLKYGHRVAFLGMDYDDPNRADALQFLAQHHVYYPSYAVSGGSAPGALLPGGVESMPTTLYIDAAGKVVSIRSGQYESQGALDADIQSYALGG